MRRPRRGRWTVTAPARRTTGARRRWKAVKEATPIHVQHAKHRVSGRHGEAERLEGGGRRHRHQATTGNAFSGARRGTDLSPGTPGNAHRRQPRRTPTLGQRVQGCVGRGVVGLQRPIQESGGR